MKKADIRVGGHYRAKVSGKLVTVRCTCIIPQVTGKGIACTTYCVKNLTTGRDLKFRSAAKFRSPVLNKTGHLTIELVEDVKRRVPLEDCPSREDVTGFPAHCPKD